MVVYESQARLSKKSEFRMKETQREVNRSHSIARVYFKILLFISDLMIPIRSPLGKSSPEWHFHSPLPFNRRSMHISLGEQSRDSLLVSSAPNSATWCHNDSWESLCAWSPRKSVTFLICFREHVFRAVSRIINARASIFRFDVFGSHLFSFLSKPVKFACAETILDTFACSRRRQIK